MGTGAADSQASPLAAAAAPAAGYAVHVHSFRDQERSNADLAQLRDRGYPCFSRLHDIQGVTWFRVYVGLYPTLEAAQAVARELQAEGRYPYSLVVKITNDH
jgi:cell division septation protein DedD